MIRIYKTATIPDPIPPQTALAATNGADYAYLVGEGGFTEWDAIGTIVGSWSQATGLQEGESFDGETVIGTPTHPITADFLDWIQPLGNIEGRATGFIDSLRWQGHVEQKYVEQDHRYPSTDSPFVLELIRQDYGSTAEAWDTNTVYAEGDFATSGGMWRSLQDGNQGNTPFGGSPFWEFINQSGFWGWVVKMISADPERDITARGIGIYTDPECTVFQYTTGAFVNDGKYGDVFYTECPPGNRLANPDQVNFALLLGSAQEGYFNLPANSDVTEALFWSANQGATPEPAAAPEAWATGVSYSIDDEVTYQGDTYVCIQAHTSQNNWKPPNVPALWSLV